VDAGRAIQLDPGAVTLRAAVVQTDPSRPRHVTADGIEMLPLHLRNVLVGMRVTGVIFTPHWKPFVEAILRQFYINVNVN
jgi:hypothetical protein